MKSLLPFILLFLVACTPKQASEKKELKDSRVSLEENPSETRSAREFPKGKTPESTSQVVAEDALVVPFFPGLIIRHSPEPKKQGSYLMMNDLKILRQEGGQVLAEFPEQVWGSVPVEVKDNSISVNFYDEDGAEFEYKITKGEDGTITESARCYFYEGNRNEVTYEMIIPANPDEKADWESVVAKLSRLARLGNPQAYKFFMHPTAEQKKYHKHDDGAASFKNIKTILQFMEKNGCKWD